MTVEQRLEQVEQQNQKIQRTNKRLTVALTMMAMVAITIQLSACGNDCNVSDVGALAGRDLSGCDLVRADLSSVDLSGADLEGAILKYANLEGAKEVPEMDASQEETACWSDCG